MRFYKYLMICVIGLSLFACSKEDNSLPESEVAENPIPQSDPTTFEFTGTMLIDKYDSNGTAVSNYPLGNVMSKLEGTKPTFKLSANNINGEALKGVVINSINISVPSTSFYSLSAGQGLFVGGVYDGVYTTDSLKYKVIYKDAAKNDIYIEYKGRLTNSY
ncbi:MAG: hypothetical protein H6587_09520 [Flavobacteriales bacterium]|nr:hypothetical protein [Flavobacteriales bacterium]MCB9364795.1 hypothetical protein [Flavobacteriales bacterium]